MMPALFAGYAGGSGTFPLTMNVFPGEVPVYQIFPYGSASQLQNYNASGGVPPYTYLVTKLGGDVMTVDDPAIATPRFSATGDGTLINTKTALWEFKVTDAALTVITQDLTLEFIFGLDPP